MYVLSKIKYKIDCFYVILNYVEIMFFPNRFITIYNNWLITLLN